MPGFFGEDIDPLGQGNVKAASGPRPVSADGLTYTDTGEPTPEYFRRQEAMTNSANLAARGRQNLITSGQKQTTTAPIQWGLGQQSPQQLAAGRSQAHDAMVQRNGGLLGDAARLGTYVGTGGPVSDTIRNYFGSAAATAINPIHAADDEGLDLVLPGGSGAYGTDLIPGVKGTGGDSMYPSESLATGGYQGGYRGTGNPRVSRGGPAPGTGGTGGGTAVGASSGIPSEVQRPDSYRSDEAMQGLRQLLAAEQQPGPSKAEALLSRATDRAASQALGIAAGARGGAGARQLAQRQALAANAAMGGQASSDLAALRADEEQQRRARQAQIMGLFSGAAQAGDARDLGYVDTATRARQAEAELANTAYQQNANRELQRAMYNAQQPTGFLDDPLGGIFSRLFGGPLRSGAKI